MAAGDARVAWSSVAASAGLAVTPAAGEEWLVHTVKLEAASTGTLQLYATTDGTTGGKKLDTFNVGSVHGLTFRLTTSYTMQLVNSSTNAVYIGYDGVLTK